MLSARDVSSSVGFELAPHTKLTYLFLLFDRYWVTFQSGGVVSVVAIIWIRVTASCESKLSQSASRIGWQLFHTLIYL